MTEANRANAIAALKRLGLSSYEARVFIALGRLDSATARDIDRMTEVPRSQVYSAAEGLEEQGLIDVQQSNPIRYRAVDLKEARARLRDRLAREEEHAFDYLEEVTEEFEGNTETRADVWTVRGRDTVSSRLVRLIGDATERVVFGTGRTALVDNRVVDTLAAASTNGIEVSVVSANPAVRDRFDELSTVQTESVPEPAETDVRTGRVLVVDEHTILLSVLGDEELPGLRREAAIWSVETGFAVVLVSLLDSWFERFLLV